MSATSAGREGILIFVDGGGSRCLFGKSVTAPVVRSTLMMSLERDAVGFEPLLGLLKNPRFIQDSMVWAAGKGRFKLRMWHIYPF